MIRVLVLGPIEVSQGERQIWLTGRHQRALVAVLASEAGKVISTQRLIDALWGDSPPASAKTKLHGHVSSLRKAISGCRPGRLSTRWPLLTRDPGYLLCVDGVAVDLADYRALLTRASAELDAGHLASASALLGKALELWRGPAYADANTPVLSSMAAALERGRLLTIERKAECDLRLGRNDTVAEELTLFLAAHPMREATRSALMLALYRLGCRAEALELYRSGRRHLRDELGIEPGEPLRRLHELMLSDDPQLASLAGFPACRNQLPGWPVSPDGGADAA